MSDPSSSPTGFISIMLSNLSNSVERLFKVGSYGLVFILIGTFFLLISLFSEKSLMGYIIGVLGSLMILAVLYLFYVRDISKVKRFNKEIQQNKEIVDLVQKAADEMAGLAYNLQEVASKYADEVADFIIKYQQTTQI